MITLRFRNTAMGQAAIGPYPSLRIGGNFIRGGSPLETLARYENHCWHIGGMAYTRYDCADPVHVLFENREGVATEPIGPFASHSAADGTMYAEDSLFARFHDETQLWQYYGSETYWPVLILRSASTP